MPVHFRRGHRDSGEFTEMNCNWLLFLIFLFVPGLRENEDSGCYRREGVSRWGTYNFSGTWNLNFFLSFSCLCFFFFPVWNWLAEFYYLDQLGIYSFNISNLFNHFLNVWGMDSMYFAANLFYYFSFWVFLLSSMFYK